MGENGNGTQMGRGNSIMQTDHKEPDPVWVEDARSTCDKCGARSRSRIQEWSIITTYKCENGHEFYKI